MYVCLRDARGTLEVYELRSFPSNTIPWFRETPLSGGYNEAEFPCAIWANQPPPWPNDNKAQLRGNRVSGSGLMLLLFRCVGTLDVQFDYPTVPKFGHQVHHIC